MYDVVPYAGGTIYPYMPYEFDASFYNPFLAAFAVPIAIANACGDCLPPSAEFEEPSQSYADPVDLLADMQIATGFDDGMSAPPPDYSAYGTDPAVAELQNEVSALRGEVQSAESDNADLRAQLDEQQLQLQDLQAQSGPAPSYGRVQVSQDVRAQMRDQVRDDIALHRQGQPLSVVEIIASARAQNYVFQVSELIDATDLNTGEQCSLTTGDLARFNRVPNEGDPAAEMRVVTSKAGSCRAGSIIEVSMTDLQDMLNAFSQRLENNMRTINDNLGGRQASR